MDSMIVNNNSYLDPNLQKATDLIRKYDLSVRTNQYAIAFVMSCVDHDKLYTKDGFNSAQEWAKDAFNLGKTQAYALIKVGANFTREIRNNKGKVIAYASTLVDSEPGTTPVIDYDMSKLIRLTKFEPKQVKAWHDAELISPRMTVKELEQFCKLQLAKPTEEPEPEQPEPTETEQPEPTETEQTEPEQPEPTETEQTEPEQPEPTEPEQPEPVEMARELPIARPDAFDSFESDWLIAELNARGFDVTRNGFVFHITFKGASE